MRYFIITLLLLIVFTFGFSQEKPNVIYFFSDTHSARDMSISQNPNVQTPNIERLADNGLNMTSCYSNFPLCTPYRAILMTGRWPWQQGLIANHMDLQQRKDMDATKEYGALGWAFKNAGYQTSYFGKWHLGSDKLSASVLGFTDKSIIWKGTNNHRKNTYGINGGDWISWAAQTENESNNDATVSQALNWLENDADLTQPFFTVVSVNPPHAIFTDAPQDKKDLYPNEESLPYPIYDDLHDWDNHQGYYAHISDVDDEIARIMTFIEDNNLGDNTIFIYTSDHGGMNGQEGVEYGEKRTPHDGSARVPFIIQWDNHISPATTTDVLFSSIDIFPTLCGLCSISEHLQAESTTNASASLNYLNSLTGLDLSNNILGKAGALDPESVFIMNTSNMNKATSTLPYLHRSVVTKDYMFSVSPQGERYLFSRADDDFQSENLVRDSDYQNVKNALRDTIAKWIAKVETPYVERWFNNATEEELNAWYGNRGNGLLNVDRGDFRLEEYTNVVPEGEPATYTQGEWKGTLYENPNGNTSVILDEEFDGGLSAWTTNIVSPAVATISVDDSGVISGNESLCFDITTPGTAAVKIHSRYSFQGYLGEAYNLSFKVKADRNLQMHVRISEDNDDYTKYLDSTISISTIEQTFTISSAEVSESDGMRLIFNVGNVGVGKIYLDDVRLTLDERLILNGEFDDFLNDWFTSNTEETDVNFSTDNTFQLSGENSSKIQINIGAEKPAKIQMNQKFNAVYNDEYQLSFMAKANRETSIIVRVEENNDDFTKVINETISLSTSPQVFYFESSKVKEDDEYKMVFYMGTNTPEDIIYIDKVNLVRKGEMTTSIKQESNNYAFPIIIKTEGHSVTMESDNDVHLEGTILVFDAGGRLAYQAEISKSSNHTFILKDAGVYIVTFSNQRQHLFTEKVVVK